MNSAHLSNILLAILVVIIGVMSMLQVDHNARTQRLLEELVAAKRPMIALPTATVQPAPLPLPVPQPEQTEQVNAVEPTAKPADEPKPKPVAPTKAKPTPDDPKPITEEVKPQPKPKPVENKSATKPKPTPIPAKADPQPEPKPVNLPPADPIWQKVGPTMTAIIHQLLSGQYDPVLKRFDKAMAAALSPDQLKSVVDPLRARTGTLVEVVDHTRVTLVPANQFAYKVHANTVNGNTLIFTITLDQANRISGLFVKEKK